MTQDGFGYGWSADQKYFIYARMVRRGGADILYLRRNEEGGYESVPFVADEFDSDGPQLSPDGRFLAVVVPDHAAGAFRPKKVIS